MEELIKKLQEKAKNCGDKTKEDRARKGAYIDCIALLIPRVVGRSEQLCGENKKPYEFDSNTYIGRKIGKSDM